MVEISVSHAPQHGEFVSNLAQSRKAIGKLHSRDCRGYRAECSPDIRRCEGLRVPHVDVALAATGVDKEDRFCLPKTSRAIAALAIAAKD